MGDGWRATSVTNTLLSDLLPGLNVSFTHDLWEARDAEPTRLGPFVRLTTPPDPLSRRFAPHLRDVRASFSLDSNFWLLRLLGLAPGRDADRGREPSGGPPERDLDQDGAPVRPGRLMTGMDEDRAARIPAGVGPWRASLNYTLNRPRDRGEGTFRSGSQMLTGNVSFRPTQNWSVHWSTAYNFTAGEFSNHVLTLTRDLHRCSPASFRTTPVWPTASDCRRGGRARHGVNSIIRRISSELDVELILALSPQAKGAASS